MLGGSFDPVHIGHLFIGETVRVRLRYDRIVFSPANRSPHKREVEYTEAQHRLRMLDLAIGERVDFLVSDWETRRGGMSYTIDTVTHLYETLEIDERLGFIMGDDLVDGFETWRDVDRLAELVDLIVVRRKGGSQVLQWPHTAVDNAVLPISASDIRNRVNTGEAYRYLVPEPVYEYIEHHDLYKGLHR